MKTEIQHIEAGEGTQHTPGPWDDCSRSETGNIVRIFAKSRYIGSIGNPQDSIEETAANACLISAAPELLEACKTILKHREDSGFKTAFEGELRDAIAKAEGRAL
jgi:hypothetical protein